MVYMGGFAGATYTTSTNYPTGSTSTAISNTAAPETYTVTETGYGDISTKTDLTFFGGFKLGSEFYLKWFPNLALGFAAGVFTSTGGDVTTNTNSTTQTYQVTSGVSQTPTVRQKTSSEAITKNGGLVDTYGIGGTTFQFTGLFTVRYVW